ncbi:hypothetical protein PIB30_021066 [Stylosanthes scabra]|uniref:Uncharacterized protein n=1 Tax=Stylosanthes scabra TaxID=79078 RepID=A0ABU6W8P0_9FABA|nr:hypothetical protein [Stylosanthes scabra]
MLLAEEMEEEEEEGEEQEEEADSTIILDHSVNSVAELDTVQTCYYRYDPHFQSPAPSSSQSIPYGNTYRPPPLTNFHQPKAYMTSTSNASDAWYPDSGATHHVTAEHSNILQSTDSNNDPEQVYMGNGQGVTKCHLLQGKAKGGIYSFDNLEIPRNIPDNMLRSVCNHSKAARPMNPSCNLSNSAAAQNLRSCDVSNMYSAQSKRINPNNLVNKATSNVSEINKNDIELILILSMLLFPLICLLILLLMILLCLLFIIMSLLLKLISQLIPNCK